MSRAWPVACSSIGSCLAPDWTLELTEPMLVQPSTIATTNSRLDGRERCEQLAADG